MGAIPLSDARRRRSARRRTGGATRPVAAGKRKTATERERRTQTQREERRGVGERRKSRKCGVVQKQTENRPTAAQRSRRTGRVASILYK